MAEYGVDTLYIQTTRTSASQDITDRPILERFISEARAHNIRVVTWYLPTHTDQARDLRRFRAMLELEPDGIGVDIEGVSIDDIDERNRRLIELSAQVADAVGDVPLAAIVLSPLGITQFKPDYWPRFPWAEISGFYDVWMPMGYWTFRREETPEWDDSYRYSAANAKLIAELAGDPTKPVHTIGGLSEDMTPNQAAEMARAVADTGGIGASLYSWPGTDADEWAQLAPLSLRLRSAAPPG